MEVATTARRLTGVGAWVLLAIQASALTLLISTMGRKALCLPVVLLALLQVLASLTAVPPWRLSGVCRHSPWCSGA